MIEWSVPAANTVCKRTAGHIRQIYICASAPGGWSAPAAGNITDCDEGSPGDDTYHCTAAEGPGDEVFSACYGNVSAGLVVIERREKYVPGGGPWFRDSRRYSHDALTVERVSVDGRGCVDAVWEERRR